MGVIASWVVAWLVPALLAVLVLASAWVGVRWYSAEYLSSLGEVPLFRSLNSRQLRSLARSVARQDFSTGSRIVTEGESEDGFFLLDKGSASVTVRGEQKATLGPGAYFGEMAVIDGGPRSATITTESPGTLLRLPSSALSRLIESDPSIADTIAAELRGRLRDAGASIPDPAPASTARDELVTLCRQLRTERQVDWGTQQRRRRSWLRPTAR